MLRGYRRSWLLGDLGAGLALTGILVPAGMAYATASGLPPITGLYATIIPLLVYAVMGPSRVLLLGPDSSLVPLVVVALAPFALLGADAAIEHAALLALLVGGILAAAGFARLGFVTDLLSMPVRVGFLLGIAVVILASQLPGMFGLRVGGTSVPDRLGEFGRAVLEGRTDIVALAIGFGCLVVILWFRWRRPGMPGVLVAVSGATVISFVLDLAARTSIAVLGPLPRGLPFPRLPATGLDDAMALLPAAFGIAVVTAADTVILSRAFAARNGYAADPDQELIAVGAANAAAGCFAGYPVSTSASRTAVAEASGTRSQLTGIVGAVAISALLLLAPALLKDLPMSALSAVVIGAALGLADPRAIARLWAWRRDEAVLALVTFLGVALVGVVQGILLAVVLSLLAFLRRAWWPHDAILGRAVGVKGYHDLGYYPGAQEIPGLVLYRFDAPLLFFNGDTFRERVLAAVRQAQPPASWVVIAAEPITDVDTTAGEALGLLIDSLAALGVTLAFAELKDPVKDRLRRYGLLARIGEARCYPTIGTAVHAYVEATKTPWVDWQDPPG
jgi:high affinity sulfate transporter 1